MKRFLIRTVFAFLVLITLALTLLAVQYFGGQPMGFFAGSAPTNLGFNNGKFVVPSWKPNWVSSTIDKTDAHYIAPFTIDSFMSQPETSAESRATAAFAALHAIVMASNNMTHKKNGTDYLYVEFKTPGLGFVDDVEIALDRTANVIHVKSGSRLGIRDFNVNRKRIEALREQFTKAYAVKK